MVTTTERDDGTWYECEVCGLMFDVREDAERHEAGCEGDDDPSYLQ